MTAAARPAPQPGDKLLTLIADHDRRELWFDQLCCAVDEADDLTCRPAAQVLDEWGHRDYGDPETYAAARKAELGREIDDLIREVL